ncbi:MAG: hypothetical protein R2813_12490 [Flavobacteriales bacterium]
MSLVRNKGATRVKRQQTGIYDKQILCKNCDNNLIGQYESYARKIVYPDSDIEWQKRNHRLEVNEAGIKRVILDVDYKNFKLFLLTILWKAHITSHEFFQHINLGKYEPLIKERILNGDPGGDDEFETSIVILLDGHFLNKSVMAPREIKLNQNYSYHFLINQALYSFNLSSHNKMDIFKHSGIRSNNELSIFIADQASESDPLRKFINALAGI